MRENQRCVKVHNSLFLSIGGPDFTGFLRNTSLSAAPMVGGVIGG